MKKLFQRQKGFTLLEILLVVAAIGILAGIVIIAINPAKQLADARNSQRRVDVNTILNGVYQYSIDNNGLLPATLVSTACATASTSTICRTGVAAATCASNNLVNLASTTDSERYLVSIPIDPQSTSSVATGYNITRSVNNRVTVCAPNAENGATISVTR